MEKPEVQLSSVHCGQGAVRAVRYNVDGNYALSCGSDKTIKLWNPVRGILIKTYAGTGNEVLDCASSSDNSQLLAGGLDRCLNILDVETGKMLRRWRAHAAKVNAVVFNEESNCAFSASMDCTLQAFDTRTRNEKPVQIFNEATDSVLSLDIHKEQLLASSADGHYRTYDIRQGSMTEDFMGDSVSCVHFTPDGNCVLASTLGMPMRLMDKNDGKMLMSYKDHKTTDVRLESVPMQNMDFVVSGSEDGFAYVYGVVDASVTKLPHDGGRVVHSVAAHPKKCHLLTTDGEKMHLWAPRGEKVE